MSGNDVGSRLLKLKAGWLCLDFANTADWHASADPQERLNNYTDLVAWAREIGMVTGSQAERLQGEAARRAREAADVLERAIALREAIYRIFSAIGHGHSPASADLGLLNGALGAAMARSRIETTKDGFTWSWPEAEDALDGILWPVTRSAADLLTTPDQLNRVGECADDRGCGWLFLDTSRNRSRRWCDMRDCGNRAKARRYYKRTSATRKTRT